jgi:phage terminase small subunit
LPGGRPPTPTAILQLNGGIRKGRHDNRDREPQPEGDAQQIVALEGDAQAAWEHLRPRLVAIGLATELDSMELTAMCEWWAEYRKWCGMKSENEYRRMVGMAAAYKQFRTIAAKFGLTPTDRVGLSANVETKDDKVRAIMRAQ